MDYRLITDEEIMQDLAERYERIRIQKRLKDTDIESKGGVSRQLLSDFRKGKRSISLKSFIRLLRGVDELDRLRKLLPDSDEFSPMASPGKEPLKRVRDRDKKAKPFKWGDEE